VTIDHHRLSPVLSGPVVAHRQTVIVGLTGRLTEEREGANRPRTAPLHGLFHTRVSHDEPAIIEHIMAHQIIDKVSNLALELRRFRLQLCERIG